jgi:CDP-6-deoxy-D-xylo-4-hexulose-3-dehydrase
MIKLANNTISDSEISSLCDWLKTSPRLTKGELTKKYEKLWSEKIGCKYSVFVNSGSSAVLLSIYSLIAEGVLKRGDDVIVPALSWSTDLSPVIQFGLNPILCDCNLKDLSVDIDHLKKLTKDHKPKALILVSVVGLVPEMDDIVNFCGNNNIILIEDVCESLGSKYKGKMLGNFGLMSCFSTYYGHHLSTIEGGMICTNDKEIFNLLKSLRSHGWDRDMDEDYSSNLKKEFSVTDDFESLYKFYYLGFNVRSTDLQAFLGINQLQRLDGMIESRNKNYNTYCELFENHFWQPPKSSDEKYVSSFSFPFINKNRKEIVKKLRKNAIEARPLIAGSIGRQPFWIKEYGALPLENADLVNNYGFYLPNNHELKTETIKAIKEIASGLL